MASPCCPTHGQGCVLAIFTPAFLGFCGSRHKRSFPFSGTERMPADEFPRILVVQLHIPSVSCSQTVVCLLPVSSAWQAVIIPLYCTVLSLDMKFPHLLLRWFVAPMIGHESLSPRQTLPGGTRRVVLRNLPVPPSFQAIRGPPCSDCQYHGTHVPPESSPSHISLRSRPCLLTRDRPYGRTPAGNAFPTNVWKLPCQHQVPRFSGKISTLSWS